jgi:hypothetical protein
MGRTQSRSRVITVKARRFTLAGFIVLIGCEANEKMSQNYCPFATTADLRLISQNKVFAVSIELITAARA